MRLILSTLFAAALVFGGSMLFAAYFDGIEVRDEGAGTHTSGSQDDRTVWHCPEVAELVARLLPEVFVFGDGEADLPDESFDLPDESFEWRSVYLRGLYQAQGSSVRGDHLKCYYNRSGEPSDARTAFVLSLAPGLHGELVPASEWLQGEDIGPGWGEDFFVCTEGSADCGFFIVETNLQDCRGKSGAKQTCD